jgi:hypothetical protein
MPRELLLMSSKRSLTHTPLAIMGAKDKVAAAVVGLLNLEVPRIKPFISSEDGRKLREQLTSPAVPRIMIVRNPYIRWVEAEGQLA